MVFHFGGFVLCIILSIVSAFQVYATQLNNNNNVEASTGSCDLFQGSWVYNSSYSGYYKPSDCSFIIPKGLDCQANGRRDSRYLNYQWKPTGCDLVRFDGADFLERYRGKKIMFVGDSLSFNMWESLGCMVKTAVPTSKYTFGVRGLLSTLTFTDYGTSFMMYKNGFLVTVYVDKQKGRILKIDSLAATEMWKDMDVLIFNSYHWWTHTGRMQTWDYIQVGDKFYKDMDHMEAYKIGLTTWAQWIDTNIDHSKTRVFFQGISGAHLVAKEWNDTKSRDCQGQTDPVLGTTYPSPAPPGVSVVKSVLSTMKNPAYLLDITLLTQLRKDGHPSIFTEKGMKDCSHWCLAGVPDAWNELLYAILIQK